MFNGLHDIDWPSMEHAYGPADEVPSLLVAMRSPDADERDKALDEFYSAVHHQGDVYPCTAASLPFLFELAGDAATPDRAAIVRLLVSIGGIAVERCEETYAHRLGHAEAAAIVRERAEEFVTFASEADPRVRRAAIPGLALFIDDASRAAAVLRDRLSAESGIVERLLVVEAMATLALRLPELTDAATAWFAGLAADPAMDPGTRLAAVVQRARCALEQIGEDAVPAAIGLLRDMTHAKVSAEEWADPPRRTTPPVSEDDVPPQVVAAFEDLDRHRSIHAPTTELLRTLHEALGARIRERTALLAEQLRSHDPGSCLDALRMSADLVKSWRGDHGALITLVAEHLDAAHQQVAAEAAAVLDSCHQVAEPAREALAAHVAAQRAAHGPDVWAAPQPYLRRAHQEAVRALARLGDMRALPSLLTALDSGVDAWRAVEVAGALPGAADQLAPRLCDQMRRVDLTQQWEAEMSVGSLLSALAALGDPVAVPPVTETLTVAVRHEQWRIAGSVLKTLAAFGPAAAPAVEAVRPLASASDAHVRPAAAAALWAVNGDLEEVMPLLLDLLSTDVTFLNCDAADVLGRIGPPAGAALPRLRELLSHSYEWVRVHCAVALWDIGGETEAPTVLETLLQAWEQNSATAHHVVSCLDRMGRAAEPALPQIRSQLALPGRGGWGTRIDRDEEMQRTCRAIIGRFG
ncbi:HEAT repeat domain-containing protein [Streptomyces phyllanthi]|uniref:HEAT repeat domain-containing protein n=1 Tax=Streptomyces phyllanthi TaxID=1803180 RepID=A0A5N8W7R3_9ACTN|nr:HEAT repeat domain-containing protein [Streptomyces phyllanthi]MPY42926.1 HEAT repeat domain-containing protein [Streptomyces phyllanthi]